MIGDAFAGDVVGRAVGDAGANDRQTERDVDGGQAGQQFQGDVPLVVIHRNHAVEFAAPGPHEERVAGQRARDIDPAALRLRDRGPGIAVGGPTGMTASIALKRAFLIDRRV